MHLLTKGHERLDEKGEAKLLSLLEAGDPKGEVRMPGMARRPCAAYDQTTDDAASYFVELVESLLDADMAAELRQLGRTLRRWSAQIVAWHQSPGHQRPDRSDEQPDQADQTRRVRASAASPTTGSGFGLYCGRPNWDLLATITPR